MKKRILALLLAGAMTFAIAACDNGSTPETTTAPPAGGDDVAPPADGGDDDGAAPDGGASGGGATTINFWTFTDESQGLIDNYFLVDNPDFKDKFTIKWNYIADQGDYRVAINANLGQSGGPDIFVADVDYARKFAELPGTATFDALGITFNESDYYKFAVDMCRVDGNVMALSHQAAPGAMYYRADLAEEKLGITSSADMQAKVKDWDSFVQTAKELKDAGVPMVYGTDEIKRNFMNNRNEGWVIDGVMNYDEDVINKFLDVDQSLVDYGAIKSNGTGQWSDAWKAGMREDVFSYFGSTWYLHYTIKPETIAGTDKATEKAELEEKEQGGEAVDWPAFWESCRGSGTFGEWGMVTGPAPFYWGGTYWFGSTTAAADADVAAGVAQIIKYFCVDDESVKNFALKSQDFVSKKNIVDQIKNDEAFNNPFFKDYTNHYVVFADAAANLDISKNITKYDADFNAAIDQMLNDLFSDNMSREDAFVRFQDKVEADVPDIKVER